MPLETGSYINDLVASNPPGTDAKAQGDDHLRLIKNALKNCFAGFTGAVVVTGTDGGAVNAYTLTTTPALIGYTARMIAVFSPTIANTGAATINISGLGAKPIVSVSNAALVSGDLAVGTIYVAAYDGTSFRLLSITKNYADQLAFSAALPAQPGGAARYELTSVGGLAGWLLADSMERRAITGTSTVTKDDAGDLIEITSGTFTLAFDPVATLGDKASGLIYNSGTGDVTLDPNGLETIDGLASFIMYPGEIRRWYVSSGALYTLVLKRFSMVKSSSGNFTWPPGYLDIDLDAVAASGGGGSGRRGAAGTARAGGAPGGAPARVRRRVHGVAPGTVIAYTVGAAGVGGAAITADNTSGNNGTAGGNTTFGTYLTAYGGAGGRGGDDSGTASATSGSGSLAAGTSVAGGANGGGPFAASILGSSTTATSINNYDEGGGAVQTGVSQGGCTIYGGAGSANVNIAGTTASSGGSSVLGVAAGGVGGHITTANTMPATAGTAGARGSYTAGGGAAGGTCGGAPTAGTAGAAATNDNEVGGSGSGGGSSITTAAAAGGNGGYPGGAPGGGGASLNGNNSGKGGDGAGGRLIIMGVV